MKNRRIRPRAARTYMECSLSRQALIAASAASPRLELRSAGPFHEFVGRR